MIHIKTIFLPVDRHRTVPMTVFFVLTLSYVAPLSSAIMERGTPMQVDSQSVPLLQTAAFILSLEIPAACRVDTCLFRDLPLRKKRRSEYRE